MIPMCRMLRNITKLEDAKLSWKFGLLWYPRFLTIPINRPGNASCEGPLDFRASRDQRIAARSPITDNNVRQHSLYWESSECGVPGGSCRFPENRGNFNRFRILAFLSLLFAHIVARVPSPFYRAMYKPGRG